MNKIQRRKIYEQVLWCIGDNNEEYVCWLFDEMLERKNVSIQDIAELYFPEFEEQRPAGKIHGWWPHTPSGNAKRRLALEKAIQLTY